MPQKKRKLTAAEKKSIVAIITIGCSRETAARYIGCTPYIIRRAIAENAKFAAEIQKAEEDSELFFLNKIRQAANKEQYWRAAAWALERRCPNRYAARSSNSLTVLQVQELLDKLADLVVREIPGKVEQKKLLKRIQSLMVEDDMPDAPENEQVRTEWDGNEDTLLETHDENE